VIQFHIQWHETVVLGIPVELPPRIASVVETVGGTWQDENQDDRHDQYPARTNEHHVTLNGYSSMV